MLFLRKKSAIYESLFDFEYSVKNKTDIYTYTLIKSNDHL